MAYQKEELCFIITPCGSLLRHTAWLVSKRVFLALVSMTWRRKCRKGGDATWYIEGANRSY
jgi:hypothetical protein